MTTPLLVVSNPPHPGCDGKLAGAALGLTAAEALLKANYSIPEILIAEAGPSDAQHSAQLLQAAGLNVVVVSGEELRDLPEPVIADGFSFSDMALMVDTREGVIPLAYADPLVAVVCKPRAPSGPSTQPARRSDSFRLGDTDTLGDPFVDAYDSAEGKPVTRIRFLARHTNFLGLEGDPGPSASGNLMKLSLELERAFPRAWVDRRLVDMRVRRPLRISMHDSRRKGFSYASQGLTELLTTLSPRLADLTDADLSAALTYFAAAKAPHAMRPGDVRRDSGKLLRPAGRGA